MSLNKNATRTTVPELELSVVLFYFQKKRSMKWWLMLTLVNKVTHSVTSPIESDYKMDAHDRQWWRLVSM